MGTFRSFNSVEQPEQPVAKSWCGGPTFAAVSLWVALAVGGCSESKAQPEAPRTSAPSSPSSPTSEPASEPTEPAIVTPSLPPEAAEVSHAGAKAFASHYIELLNYATATGDTTPLKKAATGCSGCNRYVELFERVYESGGFIETKGWVPFSEVVVPEASGLLVAVQVVSKPQRYRESSNAPLRTSKREVFSLTFSLEPASDGWTITGLQGQEVDQ